MQKSRIAYNTLRAEAGIETMRSASQLTTLVSAWLRRCRLTFWPNAWENNPFGLAVVAASTGPKGLKEENRKLSEARAMVVRNYLAKKFRVDDSRIKTMGAGESNQGATDAGRVTILVYPGGPDRRVLQARNK